MSRRTARWMTTVAAVAALGAVTAGCSGSDDPSASPDTDDASTSVEVESQAPAGSLEPGDLVPALANPQLPQDDMHADMAENLGIDEDSTRLLGVNSLGKYWVALNDEGGICLIAGLPNEADDDLNNIEVSGASCQEASVFAEQGGYLSMGGEGVAGVTLILLPDDVDPASVDSVVETASNETDGTIDHFADFAQLIATSRDAGNAFKGVEVERTDGDPLTLHP